MVSLYPYNGIRIQNEGKIIFEGNCTLGNNSVLSIGRNGVLRFGKNTCATAGVKFICQNSIYIGEKSLIGWDSLISDFDFHEIMIDNAIKSGSAPIVIGKNNWFAMQCLVLKGSTTPEGSIFTARSLLNKDYTNYPCNTMFAGTPAKAVRYNVLRIS